MFAVTAAEVIAKWSVCLSVCLNVERWSGDSKKEPACLQLEGPRTRCFSVSHVSLTLACSLIRFVFACVGQTYREFNVSIQDRSAECGKVEVKAEFRHCYVINQNHIRRLEVGPILTSILFLATENLVGWDSVAGIASCYKLDGPGIESRWEIFRTCPYRSCGPNSLIYNGDRVCFPGVKRPERGVNNVPQSSAEVKERAELYFCTPSGPSWPVIGWTLPLTYEISHSLYFVLHVHIVVFFLYIFGYLCLIFA
jgi:hypothetical protein